MQFTFDQESGVYYIQLSKRKVVDSDVKRNLVIDYDRSGQVVGIEILPFETQGKLEKKNISDFVSSWLKKSFPKKKLLVHVETTGLLVGN